MRFESPQRTCDFCNRTYVLNHREIPRLFIIKKVDIDDLTSKDFIASPDYCDICILYIQRILEKKRKLIFKMQYIAKPLSQIENNRR